MIVLAKTMELVITFWKTTLVLAVKNLQDKRAKVCLPRSAFLQYQRV